MIVYPNIDGIDMIYKFKIFFFSGEIELVCNNYDDFPNTSFKLFTVYLISHFWKCFVYLHAKNNYHLIMDIGTVNTTRA